MIVFNPEREALPFLLCLRPWQLLLDSSGELSPGSRVAVGAAPRRARPLGAGAAPGPTQQKAHHGPERTLLRGAAAHHLLCRGPMALATWPEAYRFVDWLVSAGQTIWQMLPTTPIGPGDSPYQGESAFAGSPGWWRWSPWWPGWLAAPDARALPPTRSITGTCCPGARPNCGPPPPVLRPKPRRRTEPPFAAWCTRGRLAGRLHAFSGSANGACGPALVALGRAVDAARACRLARAAAENAEGVPGASCSGSSTSNLAWLKRYANGARRAPDGRPAHLRGPTTAADCWARPDLTSSTPTTNPPSWLAYRPTTQPLGQRWGNPLYRWDRMAADGFAWWTARISRALTQADVFRIDHFRGFAGYFEIPATCPDATEGRWVEGPGLALFTAIRQEPGRPAHRGGGPGIITDDVHARCARPVASRAWRSCSSRLAATGALFAAQPQARQAVAYTGTHDNDTVLGWWHKTSAREGLCGLLPGVQRARRPLGHDPRLRQLVASIAIYPMGRARPAHPAPHERTRRHGGNWEMALPLGHGGRGAGASWA